MYNILRYLRTLFQGSEAMLLGAGRGHSISTCLTDTLKMYFNYVGHTTLLSVICELF